MVQVWDANVLDRQARRATLRNRNLSKRSASISSEFKFISIVDVFDFIVIVILK